ncbi:helix-turn-helix transcriptional regulator [Bacillus sp. CLL-7-23]|uniref:Helix-turn-helix transcriptional regulator n=1 Tax=Bacillus changyiensis TaxID=3004103 RepID=A0ABT4X649_9BACI|nr:helix-turn-helix transcriptional regulator [Bacillus changyiensis]MDA1477308.1 helix-turn-helix transcriptional regulator [Bacillus changyiensis]MDA7027748.1 helix-turn-helix transcriptional regulator [Bacillus changyiensis]
MFSENLRKTRERKKLTQQYMADKLGITRPAYTAYELGNREPDHKTLVSISSILDVSIDFLLKGESNEATDKIYKEEALKILEDPDTLIAAADGKVTDSILEAAQRIIAEQLKSGRKPGDIKKK